MQQVQLQEGKLADQIAKLPEETIQQILNQSNNWNAYSYQMQLMDGIANEMKEVPVLPSEVPTDTNPLLKVEFPEGGGVLTFMGNQRYPYKGYPHHQFVESLDFIKKASRSLISGLYHQLKNKPKILFLSLIPAFWFSKSTMRAMMYVYFKLFERIKIKKNRYCQFVRELYRVFEIKTPQKDNSQLREEIKIAVCMLLEMDNAYRFRAQDVLPELDKKNLEKRPINELLRLFTILQSREKEQQVKDTWKLIKILLKYYLKFDKELRNIIVNSLLQLDLKEVALTIEDKQFCAPRTDYNFAFMQNPTQEEAVIIKEALENKKKQDQKMEVMKESNKAHQELTSKYKNNLQSPEYIEGMKKLDLKYEALLKTI